MNSGWIFHFLIKKNGGGVVWGVNVLGYGAWSIFVRFRGLIKRHFHYKQTLLVPCILMNVMNIPASIGAQLRAIADNHQPGWVGNVKTFSLLFICTKGSNCSLQENVMILLQNYLIYFSFKLWTERSKNCLSVHNNP